nr:SPX domain-containing membrane protein At4g22990-like [Tanacetum cinerariifolium]
MVAFGKKLKDRQIQEWNGYYINYKLMKKRVKQYSRQIEAGGIERRYVLKDFSRMLDNEFDEILLIIGICLNQRLLELHDYRWYQEPKFLIKMSQMRSEGEESESVFFEVDGSSSDECGDYGVAVYDTDIEYVIEEE